MLSGCVACQSHHGPSHSDKSGVYCKDGATADTPSRRLLPPLWRNMARRVSASRWLLSLLLVPSTPMPTLICILTKHQATVLQNNSPPG